MVSVNYEATDDELLRQHLMRFSSRSYHEKVVKVVTCKELPITRRNAREPLIVQLFIQFKFKG